MDEHISGPSELLSAGYEIIGEFIFFKQNSEWFAYNYYNQSFEFYILAQGMWEFAGIMNRYHD